MSYSLYQLSFYAYVYFGLLASRDNVTGLIWVMDQKRLRYTEQIETALRNYEQTVHST
jgi:hypothetical protein